LFSFQDFHLLDSGGRPCGLNSRSGSESRTFLGSDPSSVVVQNSVNVSRRFNASSAIASFQADGILTVNGTIF
jgi:hypothetical protein